MRQIILKIFLLFAIILQVHAFQKSVFDIVDDYPTSNIQDMTLARIPYPGYDYLVLTTNMLEVNLLKEGYFTLGTTDGMDDGTLDDFQPLTYGHPLSRTSYPVIVLDSVSYRLDRFFNSSELNFSISGDSAIVLNGGNGILECRFSIGTPSVQTPETLTFSLTITNVDNVSHLVSAGFLVDPALGTWGDGHLVVNATPIETASSFNSAELADPLTINERRSFNTGMQLILNFPEGSIPQNLHADNWPVLAGYKDSVVAELFDLALAWQSTPLQLEPAGNLEAGFELALGTTDFPDGPYVRAQLPYMLDMYDNQLFPRNLNVFSVVTNNTAASMENMTLTVRSDQLFQEWSSPSFSVAGNAFSYQQVPLAFPEIYEDRVYPLTLELASGANILDVLQQNCFIPASPYSDTGLVVSADSVLVSAYPQVAVRFNVSRELTGQYVFNLNPENLFLFEDQTRIFDFSLMRDTTGGSNQVDVVFVLDVTGSMGNEIGQVKTNLTAFTDTLSEQGLDYRLAMVTFLDEIENTYDFTSDVDLFQTYIDAQYAHGGGDWLENSLDALYAAASLQFRDQARRIFIWITDAGYHVNSGPTDLSVEDVVNALLANGITCHAVAGENIRVEYCEPITYPTGGNWFDINGNFLDILLNIADLGGTTNYLAGYDSPNTGSGQRNITLEVHYAGLGGLANIQYSPPGGLLSQENELQVTCYPNPFNPSITVDLKIPPQLRGTAKIYNLKGQLVWSYDLKYTHSGFTWNAADLRGREIAAGLYFLQIALFDQNGDLHSSEFVKLVHTK